MSAKEEYIKFCTSESGLPIFFQPWYLDGVCKEGIWDVALIKEGGAVIAALPYFLKKKGIFSYITMPLFVKHLGPYLIREKRILKIEHKIYKSLLEQLPSIDYFNQDFHPSVSNWMPFHWQNFKQSTRYTYIIEGLENLEKVQSNFNRNVKRNIRKAESELKITSEFSLETFYEINKMSFERQGMPIYFSYEALKQHDKALTVNKSRKMFFAVDDQKQIHGASYLIWDKERSYYHLAGENPAFRKSGASILLIWEAIKYTKEELGLNIFDFEGSMIESIEMIRRQFGAKQVPYFRIWKYNSSLFKSINILKSRIL